MPIPSLKPDGELLVSATAIALVLAIFSNTMPPLADVRADTPGNVNTHKSTKMAGITATAAVGSLALLGKSPTVATVGFGAILFEMWKNHFANYGANGTQDNASAPAYNG
jgi:hypothetical protein